MEDRRIIKTKKTIKSTLIGILQEMPFEKITVTEICSRGIISRITFYTHYEDKYVLAEELFSDYIAEADDNYHRLQSLNNPRNHAVQGYVNLLEAILKLFYDNYSFFSHTTAQENPYLYSLFFYKVFIAVDDYLRRHRGVIPQFPRKQTAALLCNGMFGVINTCIADNMPEEKVRQMAHEIYQRLLKSELFHTVDEKWSNILQMGNYKWLYDLCTAETIEPVLVADADIMIPDFNIFLLTSQEGSNEPFLLKKRALVIMPPLPVSKT